jgi:hypothetical protein
MAISTCWSKDHWARPYDASPLEAVPEPKTAARSEAIALGSLLKSDTAVLRDARVVHSSDLGNFAFGVFRMGLDPHRLRFSFAFSCFASVRASAARTDFTRS